MLFSHENLIKKEGSFAICKEVSAIASSIFCADIYKELWQGHTYKMSEINIKGTNELVFMIGNAEKINTDGHDYAINVSKNGLCIVADNEKNLVCGFMTLIDLIKWDDDLDCPKVDCCEIKETACIKNRMIHYCVFPETELWELKRFIRFVSALKYTHLILEFWGTLKFDCLKELSWNKSFTKEDIKPIINEANALGLEIIPMFNHWGHATLSRAIYGKHTILDQNPSLQKYFDETGWCWNIKRADVRELLKKIRSEITELCGQGSYFHIGCDEAYDFDYSKESMKEICEYINEVADELKKCGRKAIMWGDMMLADREEYKLEKHDDIYLCSAPDLQCEKYMQDNINKEVIIADWQYYVEEAPLKTSILLNDKGFDVMCCPWHDGHPRNKNAAIETVAKNNLYGFIYTTWNTAMDGIIVSIAEAGVRCWGQDGVGKIRIKTATILRKIYDVNGDYEKSGWSKKQINNH